MKMIATMTAALLAASPALAQQAGHQGMNHQGMNHAGMMQPTAADPYGPDMMKMHERMMAAKGADAGETWIRQMIEHHRGAIAMSRVALRNTKNVETRQMAQMTITTQEKDIAELQNWLRKNGKRPQ